MAAPNRHGKTANYVFCDGHAEILSEKRTAHINLGRIGKMTVLFNF